MSRLLLLFVVVALASCESPKGAPESGPTGATESPSAGPSKVDGAKAKELVAAGAVLLDVRTQGEWDGGHLDGAKLIPVQELGGRMAEVGPKDQPVVVYCASGMRSARAAAQLSKAGWTNVSDLGAMSSW